jgi:hypothetical protein
MRRTGLAIAALACALLGIAAAPAFDPKPWLADFEIVREALATKYANIDWAISDREVNFPELFAETRSRIERAQNEGDARAAFDRFARRLGDGHVTFNWPRPASAPAREPVVDPCAGYDARYAAKPLAAHLPDYDSTGTAAAVAKFPAGTIKIGNTIVGVIKIGVFMPQGYPELCQAALAAMTMEAGKPCDDACAAQIEGAAYDRLTRDFMTTIAHLKAQDATVLLVDIAGNGGGSQWAEAVARMVTAKRVRSEVRQVIRGEHWTKIFSEWEADLRRYAADADAGHRAYLLSWAEQVALRRRAAATICDSTPFIQGESKSCQPLVDGFFGSGLLPTNDPRIRGKPWANLFFSPNQYPYEEGAWRGPLIVLVDRDVASAATQFTAVLQDNDAAIVIGEPTEGGCGHTNGGTPVTLPHSKGVLELPDCGRFRTNGTNEMRGVTPDILVGFGNHDGPKLRAQALARRLPEAVRRAVSQARRQAPAEPERGGR